jgi:hypothetical protein
VTTRLDVILISIFSSATILGLYSVVALLPQAVYAMAVTIVQRSYARSNVSVPEEGFCRVMQSCALAGIGMTMAAAPILWLLIPLLFGEAFAAARGLVLPGASVAIGLSFAAPIAQRISGGEVSSLPFTAIVLAAAGASVAAFLVWGTPAMVSTFGLLVAVGCVGYSVAVTRGKVLRLSIPELIWWWRSV